MDVTPRILGSGRQKSPSVHLVGILGQGMRGLARLYRGRGWDVTGCDRRNVDQQMSCPVSGGSDRATAPAGADIDLVVHSVAVSPDHPDLMNARLIGIPVLARPQALAQLLAATAARVIAIAGVSGKTTTVALTAQIYHQLGLSPTLYLGGEVLGREISYGECGDLPIAVAEACEVNRAMLALPTSVAAVTSVYWGEHPTSYDSPEALDLAFAQFAAGAESAVLPSANRELLDRVRDRTDIRPITFGVEADAEVRLLEVSHRNEGFRARYGTPRGELTVRTRLHGVHNAMNLAVAIGCHLATGSEFDALAEVDYSTLCAPRRRIEFVGRHAGADYYDDYGHNPVQIQTAVQVLRRRYPEGRIGAYFLPSGYERLTAFGDGYVRALALFDLVYLARSITGFEDTATTADQSRFPETTVDLLRTRGVAAEVREREDLGFDDFAGCSVVCFLGASRLDGHLVAMFDRQR
ncbi:Mur ligase domain-containing protein [Micromonospora sp. NPDC049523]|uniref:Mur ligase domain-containing protein n=1 Tax=Micromonospora sp. NPDC049523 TaxID=3155921 RepID=UPI003433B926